jgi:hypothetical protein
MAQPERQGGSVMIRVLGDLEDFLPPRLRGAPLERPIDGRPGVKDVIEAAGIPHPEIGHVRVNGLEVSLSDRAGAGDRIEVGPLASAEAAALAEPARFILDGHLGRLAAYLRMAGFDTRYERDADDEALAHV